MKLITKPITISQLTEEAHQLFGNLIKVVVDIEKETIVINAELHSDQEAFLLEQGSEQKNLWGINLYPDLYKKDNFIEFDSMINLRPSQNNNTRNINNLDIQEKIEKIIHTLIID